MSVSSSARSDSVSYTHLDVHAAESAREALEAFTANPFPIVVTDIRMPGMDGLALLERVRNQNPDTQVVMITGHGDMDNAVECLRLGAADFIAKPVNDDLLEHSLKRAAEQYSLREMCIRDRDKAAFHQADAEQISNPFGVFGIILVAFYSFDPFGIGDDDPDASLLQDIKGRNPILPSGLYTNIHAVVLMEPVGKAVQVRIEH